MDNVVRKVIDIHQRLDAGNVFGHGGCYLINLLLMKNIWLVYDNYAAKCIHLVIIYVQ